MRPPSLACRLVAALLGAAALAAAPGPKAPLEPMDQLLVDYQRAVKKAVAADIAGYETLQRGSPRAVIRWKGETYRFPPLPPFEPSLDELRSTFSLAAFPPEWIPRLNDLGSQLFRHGMNDGAAGTIGKLWQPLAAELEGRDVSRLDMPELGEVFPGYSAKRKYDQIKPPFEALQQARERALAALAGVPGAARALVLELGDTDANAGEVVAALQAHEAAAFELTQSLQDKVMGQVMGLLVDLQARLQGALTAKLGHIPKGEDIKKFAVVTSPRWRQQVRWNHGRQYFAGYRATRSAAGGGTGDGTGTGGEPIAGGGTGNGSGGTGMRLGGGTGNGEPPEGGVPGGGTGDGTGTSEGGGTGTGEG